jgi:capsular polysaccharide transport system permease protein
MKTAYGYIRVSSEDQADSGLGLEAQRQHLYIETIEQPNLADYPLYPKRFATFATVAATCLLVYGIAWLLVSGVREHASA